MKIKINDKITVEAITTKTHECPAGTAYWQIDYRINGETVYSCSSGAMYGQPSPIAALDWEREVWDKSILVRRWIDGATGEKKTGDYVKRTNRELLLAAIAQLA